MSNYRRLYIPGACYFFTLVTHHRQPLLTDLTLPHLKTAFLSAALRMPFRIPAIVVLPDHLHCIWSLPAGDADFASRWQFIKASFVRRLKRQNRIPRAPIWQARYWEHCLRDEADFQKHLDYIHYNPVKHGYAARAAEWRWSSFSRYVERGFYAPDWGVNTMAGSAELELE